MRTARCGDQDLPLPLQPQHGILLRRSRKGRKSDVWGEACSQVVVWRIESAVVLSPVATRCVPQGMEFNSPILRCGRSQEVRRRVVTALYVGSIPTGHPSDVLNCQSDVRTCNDWPLTLLELSATLFLWSSPGA